MMMGMELAAVMAIPAKEGMVLEAVMEMPGMEAMERVIMIRDKRVADTSTICTRLCTITTKVVVMVINQPQHMAILKILLTTHRKVIK